MARVALVTGGTRGIGEAISVALRDAGCKVAANYGGNDERAVGMDPPRHEYETHYRFRRCGAATSKARHITCSAGTGRRPRTGRR